jgi:hypothetical protein
MGRWSDDDFPGDCANQIDSLHIHGGKDWPHRRLHE